MIFSYSCLNYAWITLNSFNGNISNMNRLTNEIKFELENDILIQTYEANIFYESRLKTLPRIYKKMKKNINLISKNNIYNNNYDDKLSNIIDQNKNLDLLFEEYLPRDILGIRIIYNLPIKNSEFFSYIILDKIKNKFQILENTYIKDYIKSPKKNGYKSIHFNIEDNGIIYEIQIRNLNMDYTAKNGSASNYYFNYYNDYSNYYHF